jgi:DNA transformation protein
MATSQSTVDFLLDQLAGQGEFGVRKMFGEYCLYLEGAPVGLVCDNHLFLRDDPTLRALVCEVTLGEPYPGAKPHICITADHWDDRQALGLWVRAAAEARHAAAATKTGRSAKPGKTKPKTKPKPKPGSKKPNLADLPNLGPKSQQMLEAAGIHNLVQLRALGSVGAFDQVKRSSSTASLNLLWALEGALTGLPWQTVAREHRTSLLLALEHLRSGN